MASFGAEKIQLAWNNLKYDVTLKNDETNEFYTKQVLHGVSGFANPG
jgi:ABC-type multidrug transport system ATPase subunit